MIYNQSTVSKRLAVSGLIGALYFVLTVILYPLSYGGVQVRVSEALSVLPLFYGFDAVIGLTVGCLIANVFGTNGLIDVILGTFATLIASLLTYYISKKTNSNAKFFVGGIPPVIVNALIVPLTFLAITELKEAYLINALQVLTGQALSVYLIGTPLYFALKKRQNKKGLK